MRVCTPNVWESKSACRLQYESVPLIMTLLLQLRQIGWTPSNNFEVWRSMDHLHPDCRSSRDNSSAVVKNRIRCCGREDNLAGEECLKTRNLLRWRNIALTSNKLVVKKHANGRIETYDRGTGREREIKECNRPHWCVDVINTEIRSSHVGKWRLLGCDTLFVCLFVWLFTVGIMTRLTVWRPKRHEKFSQLPDPVWSQSNPVSNIKAYRHLPPTD